MISIIIPTLNEAGNIPDLLKRTFKSLDSIDIDYEILIIDDASEDNTADIAQELLGQKGRVIKRRENIRSLSLSVIDGIKKAKGDIIVVMDGDGSHPPELIPVFLDNLREGYDLIIGSRYIKGGGTQEFPFKRKIISVIACLIGRIVTEVKDNTSGFFCIRKEVLDNVNLTPRGFKIGLEIFVKSNISAFKEVPYIFINRKKGKSKLTLRPILQFLYQVFSLWVYKIFKSKNDSAKDI